MKNEYWVVEYSFSQNAFHVDLLTNAIKNNLSCFISKKENDYQILAICNSYEKATEKYKIYKTYLEKEQEINYFNK